MRPRKSWVLRDWNSNNDITCPQVHLLGDPDEVVVNVGDKTFFSIKDGAFTMAGGTPCKINVQGLPHNFIFGGMVQDLMWPLTMIPSTTYTPYPRQIIKPPLVEVLPDIVQIASIATQFLG